MTRKRIRELRKDSDPRTGIPLINHGVINELLDEVERLKSIVVQMAGIEELTPHERGKLKK